MITFFLIGLLVYQNADTLQFIDQDSIVDIIILEDEDCGDSLGRIVVRLGKVSDDHKSYLVYEAMQAGEEDVVQSKISFYDVDKNLVWEELGQEGRNISYDFSGIYGGALVVTIWDRLSSDPDFFVVKDGEKIKIIDKGEWQQLLDYKISPNGQYFLFYTRNPRNGKTWDYLYFYDLVERRDWDYLFPTCMSCKRGWVDINVDDSGRSEAVYKGEHRVFSKAGVLEEIFMKIQ